MNNSVLISSKDKLLVKLEDESEPELATSPDEEVSLFH